MKSIRVPKHLLYAPVDFDKVMTERVCCGVRLTYSEYDFITSETGRMVLFDAYAAAHRYKPFSQKLGAIGFPFSLCCETDDGERVAYCGMRFGTGKATEWRLCHTESEPEIFGRLVADVDAAAIPIPSGVCCIADEAAYAEFFSHLKDEPPPLARMIVLNGQTHAAIELFGNKYAVFSTGWGDGRYNCYVGLDENGETTALIVDFGMIDYPKPRADEFEEFELDANAAEYMYDPEKSEAENNIARQTSIIATTADRAERVFALARRGYAYHSTGQYEAALGDYVAVMNECAGITDKSVLVRVLSVYDNAAELFCRKSDYDSAINAMQAALAIGDDFNSGAYVRLIGLYQTVKRHDKALEIATLMKTRRPDDPVACIKYAECCVASGELEKAVDAYDRLAMTFRLYENIFDEVACLMEMHELDRASAVLDRYPAKEYSGQYYYYKACIAYKLKDFRTAGMCAATAYELDGEHLPTLYLLIDIRSVLQDYRAVARYAEEYKRLRPEQEYGYSVCAEAHLALGNFSESSRNYYYLYHNIRRDDRYAALAAITAAKTGDGKHASALRRALKRNRSPYLPAVMYATHIVTGRYRSYTALSRVVYKLNADDDFLLLLATYLTAAGKLLPAAYILDILLRRNDPPFELVAQQIRTAIRLGDDKLFDSFLDYYMKHFICDESTEARKALSERFRASA